MRKFLLKFYQLLSTSTVGRYFLVFIKKIQIDELVRRLTYGLEFILPTHSMRMSEKFFLNNKAEIKYITDNISDDLSCLVYQGLIKFRCSSSRKNLLKHMSPPKQQYFDNTIFQEPLIDEHFVDCGAFTGDTLQSFISCYGEKHTFYLFEPNPKSFEKLDKFIKNKPLQNACPFQLGTGSKKSEVSFSVSSLKSEVSFSVSLLEAESSKVTDDKDAQYTINIDSLDNVLREKTITFIKMDIEGAEYDSLIGAQEIILKNRPKLAICIYHSDEDMINIPMWMIKNLKNYNFYIRHYSDTWIETVFYAIPNDNDVCKRH